MRIVLAVLLLAGHVAAQEVAPPAATPLVPAPAVAPDPVRNTTTRALGHRYDDAKRAQGVCVVGESGALVCGWDERMNHFNVTETSMVDAPDGLMLTAAMSPSVVTDCDDGVRFTLRHPTKPVTVDWQRSTLDVDKRAVRLLPGFARIGTAALTQQQSTAAPDTLLTELVVGDLADPRCLVNFDNVAWQTTSVRLRLALDIDGTKETATIEQHLTWEPADEKKVVGLMAVPMELPPADHPVTNTLVGGGIAAGLAVLGGGCTGICSSPSSDGTPLQQFGFAAAMSGIYALLCVPSFAGIGFLMDWAGWGPVDERRSVEVQYRDAVLAKRQKLGIDPPPAGAPAAP